MARRGGFFDMISTLWRVKMGIEWSMNFDEIIETLVVVREEHIF